MRTQQHSNPAPPMHYAIYVLQLLKQSQKKNINTLPTAEILSGKNVRAWGLNGFIFKKNK